MILTHFAFNPCSLVQLITTHLLTKVNKVLDNVLKCTCFQNVVRKLSASGSINKVEFKCSKCDHLTTMCNKKIVVEKDFEVIDIKDRAGN